MKKSIVIILVFLFLGGALLSSCRALKGDPRKNCNHPDHGKYMREMQMKRKG
ncbi:MAG: hypothetical protein MRZ79_18445 [Bacteroidia bacterium]|nr:hypothetical protein [Bacteroidia bacterium]